MLGGNGDWKRSLEKVKIAEELGYEVVTSAETWGPSAIPWLSILATNTSKIQIGTAILNCFSRSPAVLAQEFSTLEMISGGRMVLGLGVSGQNVIEHFHGVPFKQPLRRLREYTEIFNLLISGEKLNYHGEIFNLDRGFTLDYNRPRNHVPVYIAAITPKSIEQTGAIADGIIPLHWPKSQFASLRATVDASAEAAGRPAGAVTIAPSTFVQVLDGRDDEKKWNAARQPLSFYINRMGVFYWQMLSRGGFEEEVAASRAAWAQRDADAALAAISERMVREVQVIGTAEEVREQLLERASLGADLQMIGMPPGDPIEAGKQLEAFIR